MWFSTFTQADLDIFKNPIREWMGEDVYGDGKRHHWRVIGQDYIDLYNNQITQFSTIKSILPLAKDYIYMTVTGHNYQNLNCIPRQKMDSETARLNVICAKVEGTLTTLKSPLGTTDYMKEHNQSVEAETLWNKYAGKTIEGTVNNALYGGVRLWQEPMPFKENEIVRVRFQTGQEGNLGDWIENNGRYRVHIINYVTLTFKTISGEIIPFPVGEEITGAILINNDFSVPVITFLIEFEVMGFYLMSISCEMIGLYDESGEFYLLIRNPYMDSGYIEFSTQTRFTLSVVVPTADGGNVRKKFYQYPTPHEYGVVHWNIKNASFDNEEKISFIMSVSGRRLECPTAFGLAYFRKTFGWDVIANKNSFGAMLYPTDTVREISYYLSRGLYWFASRCFDHPIITGVDDRPPTVRTAEEELSLVREINDYVNNTFSYASDFDDEWEFMSSGNRTGDCEDFAITKIQMLYDAGVSINKLKLDSGFPDSTSEMVKGHMWALYVNGGTEYVMNNGGDLTTVEAMLVKYPNRIKQISGLTWWSYLRGGNYTLPVESLWPVEDWICNAFTFDAYVKKLIK